MKVYLLSQAHKKVVGLHVPMDEVFAVDELDPADELVGQQQHRFQTQLPVAEVEEVLEAGSEELHDHHIVFALLAVVSDEGNAHSSLHHLG